MFRRRRPEPELIELYLLFPTPGQTLRKSNQTQSSFLNHQTFCPRTENYFTSTVSFGVIERSGHGSSIRNRVRAQRVLRCYLKTFSIAVEIGSEKAHSNDEGHEAQSVQAIQQGRLRPLSWSKVY